MSLGRKRQERGAAQGWWPGRLELAGRLAPGPRSAPAQLRTITPNSRQRQVGDYAGEDEGRQEGEGEDERAEGGSSVSHAVAHPGAGYEPLARAREAGGSALGL